MKELPRHNSVSTFAGSDQQFRIYSLKAKGPLHDPSQTSKSRRVDFVAGANLIQDWSFQHDVTQKKIDTYFSKSEDASFNNQSKNGETNKFSNENKSAPGEKDAFASKLGKSLNWKAFEEKNCKNIFRDD